MSGSHFWDYRLDTDEMIPVRNARASWPSQDPRVQRTPSAGECPVTSEFRGPHVTAAILRMSLWGITATAYRSPDNLITVCVEHHDAFAPNQPSQSTWLSHPNWASISGITAVAALLIAVLGLWIAYQSTLAPTEPGSDLCPSVQQEPTSHYNDAESDISGRLAPVVPASPGAKGLLVHRLSVGKVLRLPFRGGLRVSGDGLEPAVLAGGLARGVDITTQCLSTCPEP